MEAERGQSGMTFKQMGVDPEETARRQSVCERLNILWHKRQTAEPQKVKRIDRSIALILRAERPWMKDAAYFLY